MPKAPRTEAQVQEVKDKILKEALSIISKTGYDSLTMRKLGKNLGITATTIYDYFANKDEIYLHVLTSGFEMLNVEIYKSIIPGDTPGAKMQAISKALLHFGTSNSNYYDIMLTLHIPKYKDYVGTDLENVAHNELMSAFKSKDVVLKTIQEIIVAKVDGNEALNQESMDEQVLLLFIQWLTGMHGIISLYNNTILDYLHKNPSTLLEKLTDGMLELFF